MRRNNIKPLLMSFEAIARGADKRKMMLGIENRYHFHEIPDFDETGLILQKFKGAYVGYWHDVGHAQVQERLGITRHKDLLEAYAEEMIGIHLHDTMGLDDHFAPGQGDMDYGVIMPLMKPSLIAILEVHSKVKRDELLKGVHFIKRLLFRNAGKAG